MNINYLSILLSTTYFLPILVILGSLAVNIYFLIGLFTFSFLIIIKKINFIVDDISKILFLIFFYCLLISLINEKYFYLKNIFFFLNIIIFNHLFYFLLKNKKIYINNLIKIHLIIFIIILCDSFYQYFFYKNMLGFKIEPNNFVRLTSFFKDKYVVGAFLAKTFVPIIIIISLNIKKCRSIFFIFSLLIINTVIFLSGERASLIIFYFSIFLIFIFYKQFRKKIIIFLIMAIFSNSIILYFNKRIYDRYVIDTLANTLNISTNKNIKIDQSRTIFDNHYGATFLAAIEITKKNVFWGNGIRSYRSITCDNDRFIEISEVVKEKSDHYDLICNTHPHNFILELLTDFGIVGLLLFLFFLLKTTIKIYNLSKNNINNYGVCFGVQFLSLFFPLSTHGSLFASWNSIFFIYHFSLFYAFYKMQKNNKVI
jgi:oligosaccharide repeat unit polymerase